ncbi:ABC transporter permease, partial [Piscirickettsia salmonis]
MMADLSGKFGVEAVKMAVEDFGGTVLGKPIEVVSANHQNKVDIGVSIARRWYENDKVDLILDVPNSAIALAVQDLTRQMKRVVIFTSAGSADLTGKACSPNGMHWTYDTYAYATGVASGVMEDGGKSWFFITSDYAFGHSLERDPMAVVKAKGGQVVGSVRHPLNAPDFASYLLQAQSSKAQVVALANGGQDTVNAVKQAREFGIVAGGQRLVSLLIFLSDLRALGLESAQGLSYVDGFYWDYDDATRQWSTRFEKAFRGLKPTMTQAGVYSSVLHYLRSVAASGSTDGKVVADK